MTKQYIGNDEYRVFLTSGMDVIMSEADLQELSEDKVSYSDFNDVTSAIKDIETEADDLSDILSSVKDAIKNEDLDAYSELMDCLGNIANQVQLVKRIKTNIEIRS